MSLVLCNIGGNSPNLEYLLYIKLSVNKNEMCLLVNCLNFRRLVDTQKCIWYPEGFAVVWRKSPSHFSYSCLWETPPGYLAGIRGEGLRWGGCVGVRHGSAPGMLTGFVCRSYLTSLWKKLSSISACEFEQETNGFLPSFWACVGAKEKRVSLASYKERPFPKMNSDSFI